jgi:hypothetical protein
MESGFVYTVHLQVYRRRVLIFDVYHVGPSTLLVCHYKDVMYFYATVWIYLLD